MEFYGGQTATVFESVVSDGGDTIGDSYRGKTATFESPFADEGDTIWDVHRGKATAIQKSIGRYANCPFFDSNACIIRHCTFIFICNIAYIY